MKPWKPLLNLSLSLSLAALCAPSIGRAASHNVAIEGFAFSPSSLTINVNDTVIWTERDGAFHSTTSDTGVWNSGSLSFNSTFSFTFTVAGTYPYHCTPHPFMTGSVTVQAAPNSRPTVSIASPTNGAVFNSPAIVTIEASAGDTDGTVTQVQFFDAALSLGVDTVSPYSITSNLAPGLHQLTAIATDNAGATATSAVVTVTVQAAPNSPPTVSIASPTNGAVFNSPATVTIEASAGDTDGNGRPGAIFRRGPVTRGGHGESLQHHVELASGVHQLTAIATDSAGATATSAVVTVTVQAAPNSPPTVSIASPTNGAVFSSPATVMIEVNAGDTDGTVAQVQFFDAALSLGVDTVSPYSITSNLASGVHHLTAIATDNAGATATSAVVTVKVPLADPIAERIPKGTLSIEVQTIADGMAAPIGMGVPDDGSGRMFVHDQAGQVWVVMAGGRLPTPLLDVSTRLVPLTAYDERGLLGLAVHPNFAQNPLLYTYTSEPNAGPADFPSVLSPDVTNNHQSVIAEWRIDAANSNRVDVASRRQIVRIDKPQSNHNGGTMRFGPDGFLYVTLGDGGAADDEGEGHSPGGNGQNTNTILGKVIRIDVNGNNSANGKYGIPTDNPFVNGPGVDEIYAYGLRNPFSFSFDRTSGALYLGDVGQNRVEEVDIIVKGGNFGWSVKEGSFYFDSNGDGGGFVIGEPVRPVPPDLIDPIAQYDHDDGLAVVGGYVYRGSQIPALQGRYVFGDWGTFNTPSGRLFYLDETNAIKEFRLGLDDRALGLWIRGFGEDTNGEVYVFASKILGPAGNTGKMLKLRAVPDPISITSLTTGDGNATNQWIGGLGPFALQRKQRITDPFCGNIMITTGRLATATMDSDHAFFRVADMAHEPAIALSASLSGLSERPTPLTNTATGFGLFSLDGNTLRFDIQYGGLSGAAIAGHIHGPASASTTADVLIDLSPYNGGAFGTAATLSGVIVLSDAQKAMVLAGQTYVNLHTSDHPGGEVRGQIAPVLMQACLSGLAERPTALTNNASGSGTFMLVGSNLSFNVTYHGLSSAATAAHIHGPAAPAGFADVIVNLAPYNGGAFGEAGSLAGTIGLRADHLAMVVDGLTYVNFHTSANPGGEMRGQVVAQAAGVPLTASMSGFAERPTPLTNSATGAGTFSLEGDRLTFNIRYGGLSGTAIAGHIHGPAPASLSTGVLIDLSPYNGGAWGSAGAISGSVLLSAVQRTMMLSGLTYVNLHTSANPGGEVRGQIAPVLMLSSLSGVNERPASTLSPATGSGTFALVWSNLNTTVTYRGLTGTATAAHIHGPAGLLQMADVLVNLAPYNGGAFGVSGSVAGTIPLTATQLGLVIDLQTYVNFHTGANPAGEIRGQVWR